MYTVSIQKLYEPMQLMERKISFNIISGNNYMIFTWSFELLNPNLCKVCFSIFFVNSEQAFTGLSKELRDPKCLKSKCS